jgi:hypothetical protein
MGRYAVPLLQGKPERTADFDFEFRSRRFQQVHSTLAQPETEGLLRADLFQAYADNCLLNASRFTRSLR